MSQIVPAPNAVLWILKRNESLTTAGPGGSGGNAAQAGQRSAPQDTQGVRLIQEQLHVSGQTRVSEEWEEPQEPDLKHVLTRLH